MMWHEGENNPLTWGDTAEKETGVLWDSCVCQFALFVSACVTIRVHWGMVGVGGGTERARANKKKTLTTFSVCSSESTWYLYIPLLNYKKIKTRITLLFGLFLNYFRVFFLYNWVMLQIWLAQHENKELQVFLYSFFRHTPQYIYISH